MEAFQVSVHGNVIRIFCFSIPPLILGLQAGTALQWGAWASVGMAADSPAILAHVARTGLGIVLPAIGLSALSRIMQASSDLCQVRNAMPLTEFWLQALPHAYTHAHYGIV